MQSTQSSPKQQLLSTLNKVEAMRQELARKSLLDYITYMDDTYIIGQHHRLIAKELQATFEDVCAIKDGKMKPEDSTELRKMIFAPPRHGKSRIGSQDFPAWSKGNRPDLMEILASYSGDLAVDFSRMARTQLANSTDLWDVEFSRDSNRINQWTLASHPRAPLVAAGVGGGFTGKGAHIAIVDDPFKDWQEAASPTIRRTVINWYKAVLRTRLAKGGAVIIIMTRWHEDDLAGTLVKEMQAGDGDTWKVINCTALAEEDDIFGRQPGEALWPEMFDEINLNQTKRALGSYLFNALYQGHPSPSDGTIFKREHFMYWELDNRTYLLHRDDGDERFAPEQCWHFQTIDPTASSKKTANYFVCSTWIVTPKNDLLLYNVMRLQMEGAEQPRLIKQAFHRFGPSLVGIETNGVGRPVFQELRNAGLPVHELKAVTDKVTRAIPMGARYEVHKVFHLKNAVWVDDFEDEMVKFPNADNDDQVDTASYAGQLLIDVVTAQNSEAVVELEMPTVISPI